MVFRILYIQDVTDRSCGMYSEQTNQFRHLLPTISVNFFSFATEEVRENLFVENTVP